jgi:hypothetical protein
VLGDDDVRACGKVETRVGSHSRVRGMRIALTCSFAVSGPRICALTPVWAAISS